MALVLDGTNGVTFPVTAGSASAVQASSSRVLQVVSAVFTTPTTIARTSFTDTGVSLAITPSSTSSKILIVVSQPATLSRVSTALNVDYQLLRGSSSIFNGGRAFGLFVAGVSEIDATSILNAVYLDSPATTSSTTYKTQAKISTTANSAVVLFQTNSAVSSITLMEIAI